MVLKHRKQKNISQFKIKYFISGNYSQFNYLGKRNDRKLLILTNSRRWVFIFDHEKRNIKWPFFYTVIRLKIWEGENLFSANACI